MGLRDNRPEEHDAECEYRPEREVPFFSRNRMLSRQCPEALTVLTVFGRISSIRALRQYRTEEAERQAWVAREWTLKACRDLMKDVEDAAESDPDRPHSVQTLYQLRTHIGESVRALGEVLESSNSVWSRLTALRRMTEDDLGSLETLCGGLPQTEALSLADSVFQGELTLPELRCRILKGRPGTDPGESDGQNG